MALINCPKCGNQVSDRAKKCPHCGCSISHQLKKASHTEVKNGILGDTEQLVDRKKNKKIIIGIILTSLILCFVIFPFIRKTKNERKEDILEQTYSDILKIEKNISNVEEGYKENVELFGLKGTVTYSNTLDTWIDYTNTATWQPSTGSDTESVYEDIVSVYGNPIDDGGTFWSWQEQNGLYRVVLQHRNLGMNFVIQKQLVEE